jgi:hypothetical protein
MSGQIILFGASGQQIGSAVVTGAITYAGDQAIRAIFEDDEIVPALEVINQTLAQIDQAIIDGFAGKDVEYERMMTRLEQASRTLQEAALVVPQDVLDRQVVGVDPRNLEEGTMQGFDQFMYRDQLAAIDEAMAQYQAAIRGLEEYKQGLSDAVAPPESITTPDFSDLSTAHADIVAALQKIGICTCAEDKGGSDAGTGTGATIPGVTRLSADASAFVFQIGKFLSGVKRALCIGKSRVWKCARAGLAG